MSNEIETALNLEALKNIELQRGGKDVADWIDPKTGKTYDDVVSSTPSKYFDDQWKAGAIQEKIDNHVVDYDYPVIDFKNSDLTEKQIQTVKNYIKDKNHLSIITIE